MTHKERRQVEEALHRVNRVYGALFTDQAGIRVKQHDPWGDAIAELRFTKSILARLLAPKPAKVKP